MQRQNVPPALFDHLAPIPHLRDAFEHLLSSCWSASLLPAETLERCRRAIASELELPVDATGPAFASLDPSEALQLDAGCDPANLPPLDLAALELARRMPFRHHEISDEQVERVRQYLGDRGTVALLSALALFDAVARMTAVARST